MYETQKKKKKKKKKEKNGALTEKIWDFWFSLSRVLPHAPIKVIWFFHNGGAELAGVDNNFVTVYKKPLRDMADY
jgi:hypothetical protein